MLDRAGKSAPCLCFTLGRAPGPDRAGAWPGDGHLHVSALGLSHPVSVAGLVHFLSAWDVICAPFLVAGILLLWRHREFWGVLVGNAVALGVAVAYTHVALPHDAGASITIGRFVLATVVYDFIFYWNHRFNHWFTPAWYLFHYSHHKATRFGLHVGAISPTLFKLVSFSLCVALLQVVVDIPWAWALEIGALNLGLQFFSHAGSFARFDLGPLEYIINTPAAHAIHHARNPELLDRNFAGVFMFWDLLFGTYVHGPTALANTKIEYGVVRDPLASSDPFSFAFGGERIAWRKLVGFVRGR